MKALIEGFLKFQKDAFPQRTDLFDRSIDLLVSRLRQRLMDDSRDSTYIKTVRSEGYVFSYPVELLGAES